MKSALRSVLIALLMILSIMVPDVAHVIGFSGMSRGQSSASQISGASSSSDRVFLNQTFDGETPGVVPKDWFITSSQFGKVTVDGTGFRGRCAMIIDNSTAGNPSPYRYFAEQTNTVGISFAIKPTGNIGPNTNIEVFVDDGNFNGANIIFTNGKIVYRTKSGVHELRSTYVPDRWYNIKMVLNIPANTYNIHIDDHLEKVSVDFTGVCTQLHRIVFNETGGQVGSSLPVAYIDELWGRLGIEIPRDYPTIQEGINRADEGDLVFVTGKRTYFESVTITKSIDLVGEDMHTTIIDGGLVSPEGIPDGVSIQADDVSMYGFTIRTTRGAGIRVQGSNNTVEDNNVTGGLRDGMHVIGSGNYFAGNIITNNSWSGVQVIGSNCTLKDNTISSNDLCGIVISGSGCAVYDNYIKLSRDRGILVFKGDRNLIRNNTITANGIGLECDAGTQNNRIYQNRFIGNDKKPQALEYGVNQWDDGYPYKPDVQTGGGNYWSDLDSVDRYSGADQSQRSCFLAPDGISDAPYNLSSQIQDRYPLFIIQGVTDNTIPKDKSVPCTQQYIDYDTGVLVTAYFLRNVTVANATIFAEYRLASDIGHESVAMGISDPRNSTWKGTIPGKKYGTMVTYNVSVHAELDIEVNSTNYPLSGPFSVEDHTAPNIASNGRIPSVPDNETTILVWTIVTEPTNASGVASVSLSYLFGNTWWTADMIRTNDDNYTALMPKQPGNTTVSYNITASDKAGNTRAIAGPGIRVLIVSTLSVNNTVTSMEPCDIDLGVMYRGEKRTDSHLTLSNVGQENLAWNIVAVNSGDWLKSILSPNGVLQPGKSTTVALSIDTTSCLDPNLYVTELTVIANGSIPRWVVLLRFIVRDIVIDDSWCSLPAPLRSNINENVTFAFHAKWTHNCTDAASGTVSVGGYGSPLTVNATGWISFELSLSSAGSKTFSVSAVDFVYIKDNQTYHIKSFTQRAENLTAIWDRVKVILKVTDDRIDVNSKADITWDSSVYEYDNSRFMGSIDLNDTLTKATVGRYCITASSINDTKYGLTVFQSNSVFCIWDTFKINVGGVSKKATKVGEVETVWVVALYEYDNIVFKGANGTLYLDIYDLAYNGSAQRWIWVWNRTDPLDFSSLYDRWEKSYSFDDPGPRRFVVSRLHPVEDRLYNLTAVNDLVVPPLDITWVDGGWTSWPDPLPDLPANNSSSTVPFPTQGSLEIPSWAVTAIIVTLAIGLTMIFAMIVVSGRQRTRKDINHHVEDRHLK